MEPFSAVATTGIYCVPTCVAKPHHRNIHRFDLAAAAEAAGYRPCLRCRPYRSPQPVPQAGPELVCRAVQMVVDGALDGITEAEFGRRLGVSGRHLRRLFLEHVGVTPAQLARSRRAHFARRLLDDTDLTFTEVAFASGFGSVRQLNRDCRAIFRAPPSELRARRRRSDRLVADGGLPLRLPFDGPLEWDTMLDYFAARAIPGVEHVSEGVYRRTVLVQGHPGVLEMSPGDAHHLVLVAHLPRWEGLIHIVQRARRIFSLDAPVDDAVSHLSHDPVLGDLVAKRPGLRVPGTWDAFETGVRAIVGQQVSVAGATTITGRLVERLGTPVPGLHQLGLGYTFPSPATLAGSDPSAFSGLGLTGARIDAIRGFAAAVDRGAVRLDRSVPLEQLVASITAIGGLGPWTAHYIALRLGERDAFPAADLGLRRALNRVAPTPDGSLDTLARGWSPCRATAAVQLWHTGAGANGSSNGQRSRLAAASG
jgi:AraC family transcriptional regulator of adaptative response / DNA-3-methyladenine glycosylase II